MGNFKIYKTKKEKLLDFLLGFFVIAFIANIPFTFLISKIISAQYEKLGEMGFQEDSSLYLNNSPLFLILSFLIILIWALGIIYFWKRKKYLAYGLATPFIFVILNFYIVVNMFLNNF